MASKGGNRPKRLDLDALQRWGQAARHEMMGGLALQLLAASGSIAIAFGFGDAAENAAGQEPIVLALVLIFCGIVVRTAATWAAETVLARAGQKMVSAARTEVLSAIALTGTALLGGESSGARTAQIIDRTGKLNGYAARWRPGIQFAVTGPIIILIATATQSWLAAAILFVSVATLPMFIWLTASETAARGRAQQDALDHLAGAFQSRAAQAGLIRAFRAIGRETKAIERASAELRERTMAILKVAFLSTAIMEFFASVSIALVAVYIGFKLLGVFPFETGETLTLAEGLTALLLAPEFFAPVRKLATLHHDRADAVAAASMLANWVDGADLKKTGRLPRLEAAPTIEFDNVSLAHGGRTAVSKVSFAAHPGKITAIIGPSGAGKTTALLSLLGRTAATAGEIRIEGAPLVAGASLAESIGYAGQAPWLIEGTIFENIALAAPGASAETIEQAAEAAGVAAFTDESRGGLQQPLSRFGGGLSGGQRQRIALARILLRDAPIFLLDEPTAHLDAEAETEFIETLRQLAVSRTIIIATHSPALIDAADEIVDLSPKLVSAPC